MQSLACFTPSLKRPACLATLKSCDTKKQSVDDNVCIYVYMYICMRVYRYYVVRRNFKGEI